MTTVHLGAKWINRNIIKYYILNEKFLSNLARIKKLSGYRIVLLVAWIDKNI